MLNRTATWSVLDGGHGRWDGAGPNTRHYGALGTAAGIWSGIGAGTHAGGAQGGGHCGALRVTWGYEGHRPRRAALR